MGIYDRDYYQDNQRGFLSSLASSGQVCKYLIVANVVAFILQLATAHTGIVTSLFELSTEKVAHGEVWRLLTYAFLHSPDDLFHIVFNMLFLWWFGKEIEDLYGSLEFLCFYLVAALVGGVAFELWGLSSGHTQQCIGASGAVVAVLMVYAMHYPRARDLPLFRHPGADLGLCRLLLDPGCARLAGPKSNGDRRRRTPERRCVRFLLLQDGLAAREPVAGPRRLAKAAPTAEPEGLPRRLAAGPRGRGRTARPRYRRTAGSEGRCRSGENGPLRPGQPERQRTPAPAASERDLSQEAVVVLCQLLDFGVPYSPECGKTRVLANAATRKSSGDRAVVTVLATDEGLLMPLYEYSCRQCEHTFETLVFNGEQVECPTCESKRVERLLSVPAKPRGESSLPSACEPERPPCGPRCCRL